MSPLISDDRNKIYKDIYNLHVAATHVEKFKVWANSVNNESYYNDCRYTLDAINHAIKMLDTFARITDSYKGE